jgi:hypothetical protein
MALRASRDWLSDVLDEKVALIVLARQQRREIAMLRKLAPGEASSICPICFRDFPHASNVHDDDAARMAALPHEFRAASPDTPEKNISGSS